MYFIPLRISATRHSNLDYEIIVVDDNSPDGTQTVVRKLQEVYGENRIVSNP